MKKVMKRHNKFIKSLFSLSLAACMTISLVTGCSGKPAETPKTEKDKGATPTATAAAAESAFKRNEKGYPDLQGETIKIWFALQPYQSKFCTNLGEYEAIKQLETLLNCKLEFIHPPIGQEKDNFSIMMAGGEWPDIVFCSGMSNFYPGGIPAALTDGVAYDVTPYINETNTPFFSKKVMSDVTLKKWFSDDTGKVIRLGSKISGNKETDFSYVGPLIRKDILKATGMEAPVTVDDWYQLLTKMKKNGVEYPLAMNVTGWTIDRSAGFISSAYGISLDGAGFYVKEDGKSVGYGFGEPAYKDYLTTMNKWYSEGLINPDFMIQSMDDVQALMASGKSGAAVMHLFDYGSKYFETTEKNNADQGLVPIQYPTLNVGDNLTRFRPGTLNVDDSKTITTKAKNPMACIYFLDALYDTDIDNLLAFGVDYTMKDGVPIQTYKVVEGAPKEELLKTNPGQFHTTESMFKETILDNYNKGCDMEAFDLWGKGTTDGKLPNSFMAFTEEENAVIAKYRTELNTYAQEMILKFITGVEPLSNFDAYVERLKEFHAEDLRLAYETSLARYNKR